jgi:hypothetical protein
MTAYQQVLQIAREQSAAVARGDVEAAVALLERRGALLQNAGQASAEDAEAIREILRRDRDLSGAIRERMLQIRAEAIGARHGRNALAGYQPSVNRQSSLLDSAR